MIFFMIRLARLLRRLDRDKKRLECTVDEHEAKLRDKLEHTMVLKRRKF